MGVYDRHQQIMRTQKSLGENTIKIIERAKNDHKKVVIVTEDTHKNSQSDFDRKQSLEL